MEGLLGRKLQNGKLEELNTEEVGRARIYGFLFTASWCSPCVIFERQLVEVYNDVNLGDKVFEIVHISFDSTEIEFKKSVIDKPWAVLPYNDNKKQEWVSEYNIQSVPMLLVFDRDGTLITDSARKDICDFGSSAIDKWIAKIK